MPLKEIFVGIACNFIAAGFLWYLGEPNAGLIMLGIGFALLLVSYFFLKKPEPPPLPNPPGASIQVNPHINQQPIIQIGVTDDAREQKLQERIILEFMRRTHPGSSYPVPEISTGTGLAPDDAREILQRLEVKELVFHIDSRDFGREWFVRDEE